ncbi:10469_t:CDS:1, partial [Entrophospora sp. SA101]
WWVIRISSRVSKWFNVIQPIFCTPIQLGADLTTSKYAIKTKNKKKTSNTPSSS